MVSLMDETLLRVFEAIARNDLADAKYYTQQVCAGDYDMPPEFSAWLMPRLEQPAAQSYDMFNLPDEIARLLVVEDPHITFNPRRYWVSDRQKHILQDIVSLNEACELLEDAKIPFLNATLLFGISGTGKTQFGRFLAYSLDLPFAYVNLCNVIGASLGETGRNLRQIFDFVQTTPCVFMLDELDAIGANRGSIATGGTGDEMTRTTIALMQCMDLVRRDVVMLAATNRKDMLDSAVLRRFTAIHELKPFDEDESLQMAVNYLKDVNETGNLNISWDEADIKTQCDMTGAQAELINLCNRAIVRAVQTDRVIRLAAEADRARKNHWFY